MGRLIAATFVVFLFVSVADFLLHGVLLRQQYADTIELWRAESEMMERIQFQYLGTLLFSTAFCVIWALAFGKYGVRCGAIYGGLIGMLCGSGYIIMFPFSPVPGGMVAAWFAGGLIQAILAGVIAALIYRPRATAAPPAPGP